jgi:transglutaminase-like putative cysteine protease
MLYPVVMAVVCGIAYLTVDKHPTLGLSSATSNLLGVCTPILVYLEYSFDENLLLLALSHWFFYLQLIKIMRPKTDRDDWILLVTGLIQVVIGGVISQSDVVGMALFSWGLCSLWVLALFTLRREAERGEPETGTSVFPPSNPEAPYPGLMNPSFLLGAFRVAAMTLALGGVIFLVMPRRTSMGTSLKGDGVGKHLTGFDDEVQLGQLGEILENDSVVMTIELTDQDGHSIHPAEELLWRGVGLDRYERGRWRKQKPRPSVFSLDLPGRAVEPRLIRQQIKLEPTDNPVLFGLKPILWGESVNKRFSPEFNEVDGSIYRNDTRPVSIEYLVISSPDTERGQPKERFPGPNTLRDLLTIDPVLKAQLRPIAERVVAGTDPHDYVARGRRIESFLRDSGQFHYTLQLDVVDRSLDPVADFLLNRKEGHCEYFASAVTLLLRSIDIPARLVNGFKGGDWNDLASVLTVRQKHAHSWSEVLTSTTPAKPDDPPVWVTLDATPAGARDESVAKVGGISVSTRQFTDFIRYVWVFYIVGFNQERQQKFLYEPIRKLIRSAQAGFVLMGEWLQSAVDKLFHFPNLSSFISIRGFAVSFVGLILLFAFAKLAAFMFRRVRNSWRNKNQSLTGIAIGVLFYRRLAGLLHEYGLERPEWETPREFARRASVFLSSNATGVESVADVPPLVVDAYYRVRFGNQELETDSLHLVETRLDALEASLRPSAS